VCSPADERKRAGHSKIEFGLINPVQNLQRLLIVSWLSEVFTIPGVTSMIS
jgi:hypothetical protein